jgi:hypothetical protein
LANSSSVVRPALLALATINVKFNEAIMIAIIALYLLVLVLQVRWHLRLSNNEVHLSLK